MSKNTKSSYWKRFKMWFWCKDRIIKEILTISKIAELNVNEILNGLEKIDQDKKYICVIPGSTDEEFMTAKETFERAKLRLKWTAPKVLFVNKEIRLMTEQEKKKLNNLKGV